MHWWVAASVRLRTQVKAHITQHDTSAVASSWSGSAVALGVLLVHCVSSE